MPEFKMLSVVFDESGSANLNLLIESAKKDGWTEIGTRIHNSQKGITRLYQAMMRCIH